MIKIIKYLFLLTVMLAFAQPILAGDPFGNLVDTAANRGGFETEDIDEFSLAQTAGQLVFIFLSLFGIIFTGLILYGGYVWMMARGNDEMVDKGKKIIRTAIVGMIITFGSSAIWLLVSTFVYGYYN